MRARNRGLVRAIALGSAWATTTGCSAILGLHEPLDPPDGSEQEPSDTSIHEDAHVAMVDGSNSDSEAPPSADGGGVGDDACDGCGVQCAANAARCSTIAPNAVENCNAQSTWGAPDPCAYVCDQGACTGECTPDASGCGAGQAPQTCRQDGRWESGAPCPNVCVNGECAGSCVPGTRQCSNLTPERCGDAGTFDDSSPCPYVCSDGGCTGVCSPNDTQCAGGMQQTCTGAGQWGTGNPCTYVCAGKTCGGVCTPGLSRCSGDHTQTQLCSGAGTWGATSPCTFVCLDSTGTCGGSCTPGTTVCASSGNTMETCGPMGSYTSTTCPYPSPTCGNGTCAFHAGLDKAGDTSASLAVNYIYAIRIFVSTRATAYRLGMFGMNAGGMVAIALYSEGSNLQPSTYLGATPNFATAVGVMEAPLTAPVALAAGKYYWIAAISQTAFTMSVTTGGAGYDLANNMNGFSLPSPFPPTVSASTALTPDFYAVVQNF